MAEATKKRSLCKACGAAMEFAPGAAVVTCSGCGKKYKLPAKPGESSKPAAAAAAAAAAPSSSGARRAAAPPAGADEEAEAPAEGPSSKAAASKRLRRAAANLGVDAPKEGAAPLSAEEKAAAEKKALKKKMIMMLGIMLLTPIFIGIAIWQRMQTPTPPKPKTVEERTIVQRDFKKDLKDCEKLRDEAWECRKVAMMDLRDDAAAREAKLKEGIAAAERAKKILAEAIDSVKDEPDRASNYSYLDDAMKETETVCKSLTDILTAKPVEPEKPKPGVPMPDKKEGEKKDPEKKEGEKKEGESAPATPPEPDKTSDEKPAAEKPPEAPKPDEKPADKPTDEKPVDAPAEKPAEKPADEKKPEGGAAPPK